MADLWVTNASPLILLGRIGQLKLLGSLGRKVIVPHAVISEVLAHGSDAGLDEFLSSPAVQRVDAPVAVDPSIAAWDLGRGESEVLSWALLNKGSEALLDDLVARKCARSLGVPIRGTVGIILLARQRDIVPEAAPLIEALMKAGLRFDLKWISEALSLVGERLAKP